MLNYFWMTDDWAQPHLHTSVAMVFKLDVSMVKTDSYCCIHHHLTTRAAKHIYDLSRDGRRDEHKWLENTTCSVLNAGGEKNSCAIWDGKHISLSSACYLYNQPWKLQVIENVGWNTAWQIPVFYSGISIWRLSSTQWLTMPLWNFL